MPRKRKPHHPLHNWQAGVEVGHIDRWQPSEPAPVPPAPRAFDPAPILDDELSKGCTPAWMAQMMIRSEMRRLYGRGGCSHPTVQNAIRSRLTSKYWRFL